MSLTWELAFILGCVVLAAAVDRVASKLSQLGKLQIERERDLKREALEDVPRLREELDALKKKVSNLSLQTDSLVNRRK